MITITEHKNPPYIEFVVFDQYPQEARAQFEEVLLRYAEQYPEFCLLEVRHGKISNELSRLMLTAGKVSEEILASLKKLKRVALVGDELGFLVKLISRLPRFGSAEIRLFKLHELDQARAWMKL